MNKLMSSVLEKVSENNNEYRTYLRNLNSTIDDRTSSLVSDIVTASSYTLDFSNALDKAKNIIVNPVARIVESYVIKDLRAVETVNEQFIEKINDKLDNANISSDDEKKQFNNNLHSLLNDKYLEIVKIKRVPFLNEQNVNEEIEDKIKEYQEYLNNEITYEDSISNIFSDYKQDLYNTISEALIKISDLYQNNFIDEVSNNLNSVSEYEEPISNPFISNNSEEDEEDLEKTDTFTPFVPEMINVPEVPEFSSIPEPVTFTSPLSEQSVEDEAKVDETFEERVDTQLEITPITPVEVEIKDEEPKRSYGVDEILKIAKSPILEMPEKSMKVNDDNKFVNIEPIVVEKDKDIMDSEFSEREIIEEMISRLQRRLNDINERKKRYDEDKDKLKEDEAFVNDLIESSKSKNEELDKFEKELEEKEIELSKKEKDLEKKINDVMPFANAVLKSEEES